MGWDLRVVSSYAERIRSWLPPFMRPGGVVAEAVTGAVGEGLEELAAAARLLRARGAANRFAGNEFLEYYGSAERQDDVARLGMSRLLSKRANESWIEFEERVAAFVGLEEWTAGRSAFPATGDVSEWGAVTGIVREVQRTGLHVESFVCLREDHLRWLMRDLPELTRGVDDSMMLEPGEERPEGQRLTRVYDLGEAVWGFWLTLTDPDEVAYLADEVRAIIRDVKPAWTRCFLLLPGASDWEVVD
jgi:hypothetical protein